MLLRFPPYSLPITHVSILQERLQELTKYRAEHGSCNVPNKWKGNPALGKWVNAQRQYYRAKNEGKPSSLTAERIARLEALGFEWTLRSLTPWESRLEELKAYKAEHSHVQVPQKDKAHKGLARWVDTQRQVRRGQCYDILTYILFTFPDLTILTSNIESFH